MENNYFNFFGLSKDATLEEIKAAYHTAARSFHPDRNDSDLASNKFIYAQEAFEVLSDPFKREQYLQKIVTVEEKSPISIKKAFSLKAIPLLNERQLLYVLLEIDALDQAPNQNNVDLEICLIVDYSTSMAGKRLEMIKSSISKIVKKLKKTDVISIVGFSDFAKLIVPPVLVKDYPQHESKLLSSKASGATEIFKGLELGLKTLSTQSRVNRVKRLILLTDGHTYGDEESCLELAKVAAEEKISIYALGFGDKWNDEFLDKVTSCSGGNASLVSTEDELMRLLNEKIFSASRSYAQQIKLDYTPVPEITLNYMFRLIPDASQLVVQNPVELGNINYGQRMLFLLEFLVDPIRNDINNLEIFKGKISFDIPTKTIHCERYLINWNRMVTKSMDKVLPPESILHAISRLTLYRMQEKIKIDLANKKNVEASRKLKYLASQLKTQGENDLARTVLFEADHVEMTGNFTQENEKRIKYGTRALLLPSGLESEFQP